MIRFIDLGEQVLDGKKYFAWFDTITDAFETYGFSQTWKTWEEFEEDHRLDMHRGFFPHRPIERYERLFGWRKKEK